MQQRFLVHDGFGVARRAFFHFGPYYEAVSVLRPFQEVLQYFVLVADSELLCRLVEIFERLGRDSCLRFGIAEQVHHVYGVELLEKEG